jgi:hypothetical protein
MLEGVPNPCYRSQSVLRSGGTHREQNRYTGRHRGSENRQLVEVSDVEPECARGRDTMWYAWAAFCPTLEDESVWRTSARSGFGFARGGRLHRGEQECKRRGRPISEKALAVLERNEAFENGIVPVER